VSTSLTAGVLRWNDNLPACLHFGPIGWSVVGLTAGNFPLIP